MITDTREKILGYIRTHKQARVHDLVRVFGLSHVAIHKQLKKLLDNGQVKKVGKPPLVLYVPTEKKEVTPIYMADDIKKIIDDNYLYISPIGELLYGFEGFIGWIKAVNEKNRLSQMASEYVKTFDQLKTRRSPDGWINATEKLQNTFEKVAVDRLFYGDFYSIPKFGKTKLGQLVLYAKQSQNRELINEIAKQVKPLIQKIIEKFSIDAVAFVPPTVPRTLQFMNAFERELGLKLPSIELVKVTAGEVAVAQKTLSRLEERVENAKETIYLKNHERSYPHILLIDDAAGSGSTFNETAKKFKGVIKKSTIIAFAIVGSFKEFDVIREV